MPVNGIPNLVSELNGVEYFIQRTSTDLKDSEGVNPFAATHFFGGCLVVVGVCVGV
jgi:hypothetical protein